MSFIYTQLEGERSFVDTLRGEVNDPVDYKGSLAAPGINRLIDKTKDLLTDDPLSTQGQTLRNDLNYKSDVDNATILSHFNLSGGKNRFYIRPGNLNKKINPTVQDVQNRIFPHETPVLDIYITNTVAGNPPRAGATLMESFTFMVNIYVTGYDAQEVVARTKIISQAVKYLILQGREDTPILSWRSGALLFLNEDIYTTPIARSPNGDILTQSVQEYSIQKDQSLPNLSNL